MRAAKLAIALLLGAVLVVSASVALAASRVALVVGNSTDAHIGRLPNPENDAVDLAATLRRLGFEVTTELDTDRAELAKALRAFTRRSDTSAPRARNRLRRQRRPSPGDRSERSTA